MSSRRDVCLPSGLLVGWLREQGGGRSAADRVVRRVLGLSGEERGGLGAAVGVPRRSREEFCARRTLLRAVVGLEPLEERHDSSRRVGRSELAGEAPSDPGRGRLLDDGGDDEDGEPAGEGDAIVVRLAREAVVERLDDEALEFEGGEGDGECEHVVGDEGRRKFQKDERDAMGRGRDGDEPEKQGEGGAKEGEDDDKAVDKAKPEEFGVLCLAHAVNAVLIDEQRREAPRRERRRLSRRSELERFFERHARDDTLEPHFLRDVPVDVGDRCEKADRESGDRYHERRGGVPSTPCRAPVVRSRLQRPGRSARVRVVFF
mmetsp:Transcript_15960/g.50013  ORF Transcript_15960/g.50013 Transcript_15960/m.50013 type:complete len:318 (-) Transcript_15960:745-1698(-)